MRCWRAPKSRPFSPTTISSPSSTTFSGRSLRNAGRTSGKYRVIGRAPRLTSSTLSPSRKTSVRNPSHLGSYSQLSPLGMPSPGADSIGSISSAIGSFIEGTYPQFVYILWTTEPCATISPVGKPGSDFDSTPPPQPWEARASVLPALWPNDALLSAELRDQLGYGHLPEVLAHDGFGGVPDHLRLGRATLSQLRERDRAKQLNLRNLLQLLGEPLGPLSRIALARRDFGVESCLHRRCFGLSGRGGLGDFGCRLLGGLGRRCFVFLGFGLDLGSAGRRTRRHRRQTRSRFVHDLLGSRPHLASAVPFTGAFASAQAVTEAASHRPTDEARHVEAGETFDCRRRFDHRTSGVLGLVRRAIRAHHGQRIDMAHWLRRRAHDVGQRAQHRLDDGGLVELLVGLGAHRQRLGFRLAFGEDDLGFSATFQARGLGIRLGGSDAGALCTFGAGDHGLCLRGGRLHRGRQQLLLLAVCLQLRELGLPAHDLLLRLCLSKRTGLVGARLGGGNLSLGLRLSQRDVPACVDLHLLRFGLSDRCGLVRARTRHAGVALDGGEVLLAEQPDVVRFVRKALDGEGVDLETAGGEVALGRVLYLLQELLAVADQLFDCQRADDRAQRPFENVLDDRVDLFGLGVEESLGRVAEGLDVAADLERGHALDLNLDALACHRVAELHVDLASGELQMPNAVEQRAYERPASDHDLYALVT